MIDKKILLASKSPRRRYLLGQADIPFDILEMDFEEIIPSDMAVKEVAEFLAIQKAEHGRSAISPGQILITADTIVILNGVIFGKPKNRKDAYNVLSRLSGERHEVITGVCLMDKHKMKSFSISSFVDIAEMESDEINYYIENYNVLDKAGAYGIQDWLGWCKITNIEGSYSNIMGLPMAELYEAIRLF